MVAAILSIILIIFVKAFYDASQIKKGKGIAHSKEWVIVAICSLPAIYIFGHNSPLNWYLSYPLVCVMCMTFIWFFFDGVLNKIRGYGWWYTGVHFSGSAKSDGLLQHFSIGEQKVIKIMCLIVPIAAYVFSL